MVRRVRLWQLCLLIAGMLFLDSPVYAELQSPNYQFSESSIGSGGLVQSSSTNFQARSATGDIAVGESASNNFQVQAGSKTTPDPALTFVMNSGAPNFGSFSATSSSVATASFSVSNYTSYGYAVQVEGPPPTNGTHVINAMASSASPQVGIEQFGINLVANTTPSSVGANPDHGDFGVGSAAVNYNTPNIFRYVSGETIASSPKTSGLTRYTISYLVNVESLTPGGQYKTNQTIIVTGTF